jgi:hypothetical protein
MASALRCKQFGLYERPGKETVFRQPPVLHGIERATVPINLIGFELPDEITGKSSTS